MARASVVAYTTRFLPAESFSAVANVSRVGEERVDRPLRGESVGPKVRHVSTVNGRQDSLLGHRELRARALHAWLLHHISRIPFKLSDKLLLLTHHHFFYLFDFIFFLFLLDFLLRIIYLLHFDLFPLHHFLFYHLLIHFLFYHLPGLFSSLFGGARALARNLSAGQCDLEIDILLNGHRDWGKRHLARLC